MPRNASGHLWKVFSVSNSPSADVQGHYTSSTSIFVQWRGTVLLADQNGTVQNYTITYKALPDGSQQTKVVSAPTTQVTLTGLNEYTNRGVFQPQCLLLMFTEMEKVVILSLLSLTKAVSY